MEDNYKNINIAFATDENYAKYTGAAMYSIIKNRNKNDKFHFYIIDNGISQSLKQKMSSILDSFDEITFLNCKSFDKYFDCLNLCGHLTKTAYYRCTLPEILEDLDKILYLDCDVIVNDSLSELYETDIKDYLIGAVHDPGIAFGQFIKDAFLIDNIKCKPINSGVLLMNLKKMREEKVFSKIIKEIDEFPYERYHDQSKINRVCDGKILFLDYKWNYMTAFNNNHILCAVDYPDKVIQMRNNPSIIHYAGAKPWTWTMHRHVFMKFPHIDKFLKYFVSSPFIEDSDYKKIQIMYHGRKSSLIEKIFYVRNEYSGGVKYKIITILGVKIKFSVKPSKRLKDTKSNTILPPPPRMEIEYMLSLTGLDTEGT